MKWSQKRQLTYFITFIGAILLLGFFIVLPYFTKEPTCFDGVKNGTELEVDCGGECEKACLSEVTEVVVQWTRSFEVDNREYNAVAYLENRNPKAGYERISYRFKLLDENNALIADRLGETFINPNGTTAIFEPRIQGSQNRKVVRTTFEFIPITDWKKVSKKKLDAISLELKDFRFSHLDTRPRLSGRLFNHSLYTLPNLEVVAILYNDKGDAVHVSKTELSYVQPDSQSDIFFTWPRVFDQEILREEYIPRCNIYTLDI